MASESIGCPPCPSKDFILLRRGIPDVGEEEEEEERKSGDEICPHHSLRGAVTLDPAAPTAQALLGEEGLKVHRLLQGKLSMDFPS